MRLIDCHKAKRAIYQHKTQRLQKETVLKILDSAPTIDAVPVVRCKDCKKWEADGAYEFDIDGAKRMWGVCSNSLHHCKDNHFCSYGEREEVD